MEKSYKIAEAIWSNLKWKTVLTDLLKVLVYAAIGYGLYELFS